jgi:hypothetical protein
MDSLLARTRGAPSPSTDSRLARATVKEWRWRLVPRPVSIDSALQRAAANEGRSVIASRAGRAPPEIERRGRGPRAGLVVAVATAGEGEARRLDWLRSLRGGVAGAALTRERCCVVGAAVEGPPERPRVSVEFFATIRGCTAVWSS